MLTLGSVSAAWQILHRAGVPLAGERFGPAPRADEIGAALREVLSTPPAGREGEALAAFVAGWQAEFPTSFAAALAGDADRVLEWARTKSGDRGRYLKLRRIAIAHLSHVL
jgi:hypothetical protein